MGNENKLCTHVNNEVSTLNTNKLSTSGSGANLTNVVHSITAGNAGNVLVLIDNKVKVKIGDTGQVVDSIVIESTFNN